MGHQRLGEVPKTQRWSKVVATVASVVGEGSTLSESTALVADRTLDAAAPALQRATEDTGLSYTFYLLTQIALASREKDWRGRLEQVGIHLDDDSSLFELITELQQNIDDHVSSHGRRTDVGEMAQQAAGEAISRLTRDASRTLFGSGSAELQDAVRKLSTKAGFSNLGQQFFGCFMSRFLNFYISRISAGRVGNEPLTQVGELARFNDSLDAHCKQSARIVRDFCGEWYSKTEFQQGIDKENTNRFMAVALRKLADELRHQKEEA